MAYLHANAAPLTCAWCSAPRVPGVSLCADCEQKRKQVQRLERALTDNQRLELLERGELRPQPTLSTPQARHNRIAGACRHCQGQVIYWRYPDGEVEAVCVQCSKPQRLPVDPAVVRAVHPNTKTHGVRL